MRTLSGSKYPSMATNGPMYVISYYKHFGSILIEVRFV